VLNKSDPDGSGKLFGEHLAPWQSHEVTQRQAQGRLGGGRLYLGKNYNFETHFGGVVFVFLRGVRPERKQGFFVHQVGKR